MNLRRTAPLLAASALLLLTPTLSFAQRPGGGPGGGGPGGGGQMSPEVQAKLKKFRAFQENHKNYRALSGTIRAISEMNNDPKTALTKDQAKKALDVVNKWKTKPFLTDAQAGAANKELTNVLNLTQIKKMATLQQQGGGFGGPGGGGGGRPGGGGPGGGGGRPGGGGPGGGGGRPGGGGPGGGGGGRGGFDFSKMPDPKEYNPLNPATQPDGPMKERQVKRMNDFVAMLKKRAG